MDTKNLAGKTAGELADEIGNEAVIAVLAQSRRVRDKVVNDREGKRNVKDQTI
jgi:hypothetical protein